MTTRRGRVPSVDLRLSSSLSLRAEGRTEERRRGAGRVRFARTGERTVRPWNEGGGRGAASFGDGLTLSSADRSDAAIYATAPPNQRLIVAAAARRENAAAPRVLAGSPTHDGGASIKVLGLTQARRATRASRSSVVVSVQDNPFKLLIVRDPSGKQKTTPVLSPPGRPRRTAHRTLAARLVARECMSLRQQRGCFEHVAGWCQRTVERGAPSPWRVTLFQTWLTAALRRRRLAARKSPQSADGGAGEGSLQSYLD